jgi:mRNA interferase RelE/StbE
MKVSYLPSFLKELKVLRSTPYFKPINTLVFEEIPKLACFADIKNLKKLQGYENAYRIKVGDYRIGVIA